MPVNLATGLALFLLLTTTTTTQQPTTTCPVPMKNKVQCNDMAPLGASPICKTIKKCPCNEQCGDGLGAMCENDFNSLCCASGTTCGHDDFNVWCCPPGCTPQGTYSSPPAGNNVHCMTAENYSKESCDCNGAPNGVEDGSEDEVEDVAEDFVEETPAPVVPETVCNAPRKRGCDKMEGCEWRDGECAATVVCEGDRKTCNAITGCRYNRAEKTCVKDTIPSTCADVTMSSVCRKMPECTWTGASKKGLCINSSDVQPDCAKKGKNPKKCKAIEGCQWMKKSKSCVLEQ